ncbi:hypothetical protein SteCoe_33307 [Stentor coeruleus]|uniref:MalT-like TPR region domain-containing protein n=1 Tax=Stentor coeruleus TaxID=5963 RepID=A0A1R2AX20_9CILI|nr:hypothetical protein SteCoe_33307 [Stentor coeruleus]
MADQDLTELESIVLRYNKVAMDYLRTDNFKETLILLKKAENILSTEDNESLPQRLKLVSITYNNLGCYYKKHKKPLVALSYLQKALELEEESDNDSTNIASSHLNICAILSSVGKHEEALEHSKKAIELLEAARIERPENVRIMSNLVVSHYNLAAEFEHIGRLADALSAYLSAFDIAEKELGKQHPLYCNIENAILKIKHRLSKFKSTHGQREFSPIRMVLKKHIRFPSITPTLPKGRIIRNAITPGKMPMGRSSPYENIRNIHFKESL